MNREKILKGIYLLLEGIGEDPDREGLAETPERILKMIEFFNKTASVHNIELFQPTFHAENYKDFVLIKNITFSSFCEHHLMPFFGKISIAYLPSNETVIGLSKIVRVVNKYSRRLQLQERLSSQIANALDQHIKNNGIFVLINAHHMCMGARGVMQPSCSTVTRAMTGEFKINQALVTQIQQLILTE